MTVIEPNSEIHDSDLRIVIRDILSANKISNQTELTSSLKRVEQLWDALYQSVDGNELLQLADLIFNYENKNWDSYFNEADVASDDFMAERAGIIEKKAEARGILSEVKANKDVDDESPGSSVNEGNEDKTDILNGS